MPVFFFRRKLRIWKANYGLYARLGTLSIDNKIHEYDILNRRRIGWSVSFPARKTKVKQCAVFREEATSFGYLSRWHGFQKLQKPASN